MVDDGYFVMKVLHFFFALRDVERLDSANGAHNPIAIDFFLLKKSIAIDVDLNSTLSALEGYLADFKGDVLVVVSHGKFFTDKVTDHLFVFEGVAKD
jgi:hypothetical protein